MITKSFREQLLAPTFIVTAMRGTLKHASRDQVVLRKSLWRCEMKITQNDQIKTLRKGTVIDMNKKRNKLTSRYTNIFYIKQKLEITLLGAIGMTIAVSILFFR